MIVLFDFDTIVVFSYFCNFTRIEMSNRVGLWGVNNGSSKKKSEEQQVAESAGIGVPHRLLHGRRVRSDSLILRIVWQSSIL